MFFRLFCPSCPLIVLHFPSFRLDHLSWSPPPPVLVNEAEICSGQFSSLSIFYANYQGWVINTDTGNHITLFSPLVILHTCALLPVGTSAILIYQNNNTTKKKDAEGEHSTTGTAASLSIQQRRRHCENLCRTTLWSHICQIHFSIHFTVMMYQVSEFSWIS